MTTQPHALTASTASSSPRKDLRRIWIVCTGSRGDVQPFVAVGSELVERGFDVTCFTMDKYVGFCESFGMKGVALLGDSENQTEKEKKLAKMKVDHNNHDWTKGSTLIIFPCILLMQRASAEHQAKVIQSYIQEDGVPDLCIHAPLSAGIGWYLAAKHDVPFIDLFANKPIFGYAFTLAIIAAFDKGVAKKMRLKKYLEFERNPNRPQLFLFSPELAKAMYPEAKPASKFVGTTFIDVTQQCGNSDTAAHFGGLTAKKIIDDFLNAPGKQKPVYLGWGSMISMPRKVLAEYCVRVAKHANQRAVVLGGEAKLSVDLLEDPELIEFAQENILFVESAPHEYLFPRMSAVVHHGGAGTTTTALRSGRPNIITPVLLDQYDHSRMIRDLGVGAGFKRQMQKISWKELGDAIFNVVNDKEMLERCELLAEKLRAENGARVAAHDIESFWDKYCADGRFPDLFKSSMMSDEYKGRTRWSLGSFLKVAAPVAIAAALAKTVFN